MTQSWTRMESRFRGAVGPVARQRSPRRAFTLVEVLLVLAIVVIIAGVAGLAIKRPLARQRLHSAADAVRTEWCQARVDAMKSGHTYAFRYMVHGRRYRLGAQDDQPLSEASAGGQPAAGQSNSGQAPAGPSGSGQSTAGQPAAGQSAAADDEELGDDPLPPPVDKNLPTGIRFVSAEGGLASLSDDSDAADESGDWSDPIYFYADGTTSDAKVLLASDRHSAMRLQLRGVTGSVTVDDNVTAMTQ